MNVGDLVFCKHPVPIPMRDADSNQSYMYANSWENGDIGIVLSFNNDFRDTAGRQMIKIVTQRGNVGWVHLKYVKFVNYRCPL